MTGRLQESGGFPRDTGTHSHYSSDLLKFMDFTKTFYETPGGTHYNRDLPKFMNFTKRFYETPGGTL